MRLERVVTTTRARPLAEQLARVLRAQVIEARTRRGDDLHALATEEDARLIVTTQPAAAAIHRSPCPVAVLPRGAAEPVAPLRLGVACDGSKASRAALRFAAAVARPLGSPVQTIDVIVVGDHRPDVHAELAVPARVQVRFMRRAGHPPTEIVAATSHLDLLVMGSRDLGPVQRILLGSVSTEVVRHSQCPVVVVPRGVPERAVRANGGLEQRTLMMMREHRRRVRV